MSDEPRDPDLAGLLELMREQTLDGIRVSMPGLITAYDAVKQRASVQPLIQDIVRGESGEDAPTPLPEVHDVPVMFCGTPRGRITWPVASGDACMLFFASSSISRWLAAGGGITDPGDSRRHDLSDAVAWVGMHDFAHVPTDAPTDAVVVHVPGGVKIKLGSSGASDPVLRVSDLAWLIAAFNSHTHLVADVPSAGPATVDVTHTIPVPSPDGSPSTLSD